MKQHPSRFLTAALRIANKIHVALYRISGGKLAGEIGGMPLLLITTRGGKTGKLHTNPVVYLRDGQDYLVSASNGGLDWNPAWYFNLKNRHRGRIQVGGRTLDVNATIIEGDEHTHLYARFKAASPNFIKYEKGTSRVIRLTPTEIS